MRRTSTLMTLSMLVLAAPLDVQATARGCAYRPGAVDPEMPEILIVVNGDVRPEATPEEDREFLESIDIDHVEIICWRAAEAMFGVRVRSGVISVVTDPNPLDLMRSLLGRLVTAQAAFHDRHRHFAGSADDLAGLEYDPRITLDIATTPDGWRATSRHEWMNFHCIAFVGTAPEVHERGSPVAAARLRAGQPACFSQHVHGR